MTAQTTQPGTPPGTDREQHIAGLRQLADALERNPATLPLPCDGRLSAIGFYFIGDSTPQEWEATRAAWRAAAAALPCKLTKELNHNGDDRLEGRLGGPDGLKVLLTAPSCGPARFCSACGTELPGHTASCEIKPAAVPVATTIPASAL